METTLSKTMKTAAWVGLSAFLGFVVTALQGDTSLLRGTEYAPFINVALVMVKNLIDSRVPNI